MLYIYIHIVCMNNVYYINAYEYYKGYCLHGYSIYLHIYIHINILYSIIFYIYIMIYQPLAL